MGLSQKLRVDFIFVNWFQLVKYSKFGTANRLRHSETENCHQFVIKEPEISNNHKAF